MQPVTIGYPGYQVKAQYKHLLPKVYGRPSTYVMTPYCLPSYDPMYQNIMRDLHATAERDRKYFGAINFTLQ